MRLIKTILFLLIVATITFLQVYFWQLTLKYIYLAYIYLGVLFVILFVLVYKSFGEENE